MQIDRQKQLFVDDAIIETMDTVSQVLNAVTKSAGNPVLRPEHPCIIWIMRPLPKNRNK